MSAILSLARSVPAVAVAAAALILPAAGHAAAPVKPRCPAVLHATTAAGHAKTIRLRCAGRILHVQLADPALHGSVSRLDGAAKTVRYTPAARWSSHDGAASADAFTLQVENRKGIDRVLVKVDVRPSAPVCHDGTTSLTGSRTQVDLRCSGLVTDPVFSVVSPPRNGTARIVQSTGQVLYTPRSLPPTPDRFTYRARNAGGTSVTRTVQLVLPGRRAAPAVRADGNPTIAAPTCTTADVSTHYVTPVDLSVRCSGADVTVAVTGEPTYGDLENVRSTGDTTTARYVPPLGYDRRIGPEQITFTATNAGGSAAATVKVDVRPYRFVAFGDSVTAGFGYYGDGDEMSSAKLVSCSPGETVNGQCSSNSKLRGGEDAKPPSYTSDYGLANNVSWAAQFANSLQGGELSAKDGMYANYAVTGSSPGDWFGLPSDAQGPKSYPEGSNGLKPTLDTLLASEPELAAFTIGANPVLSFMMGKPFGIGKWFGCATSITWSNTISCLEPKFADQVRLRQHLKALYTYMLEKTTSTKFVVMPYHLTVPGVSSYGWGWWQLEGGIDILNQTIDNAVADVRAARPQDAARLLHVEAEFNPNAKPDPTKLARFNYGGSSTRLDPPSCIPSTVDCRKGGPNDYGWDNRFNCHWFTSNADGPSHQATVSQVVNVSSSTCGGTAWIISTDTGIHPNRAGYERFAGALENFASARKLVPALPDPPKRR